MFLPPRVNDFRGQICPIKGIHLSSWKTVYSHFRRWNELGIWEQVFNALITEAQRRGDLDWDLHHVDSTIVRAHQHAAGARKRGDQDHTNREQLGRSRGGFSTKLHMRGDGKGLPLRFLLTPGQSHDQKSFAALINSLQVRSGKRGRARSRPRKIVADAAYLACSNRQLLRQRGIGCVIPRARSHRRRGSFDSTAYRQRNQVERFLARIKQLRRIATRSEKLAAHYLAIVTLAAMVIWLRELTLLCRQALDGSSSPCGESQEIKR